MNRKLDDFVKMSEGANAPFQPIWQDGRNYIYHNQLAGKERKDGWPPIESNEIYPGVMQAVAIVSQQPVKIVCRPWETSDGDTARTWSSLLQWQYEKVLDMNTMRIDAMLDGAIYGYYVGKFYWEPEAEWIEKNGRWYPQGAVQGVLIRPELFGLDPEAEKYKKAAYCYTRMSVRLDKAIRRWPMHEEELTRAAAKADESQIGAYLMNLMNTLEGDRDRGVGMSSSMFGRVANFLGNMISGRTGASPARRFDYRAYA